VKVFRLFLFSLLALPSTLLGQERVRGIVTDVSGAPMASVAVFAGIKSGIYTGNDGSFDIPVSSRPVRFSHLAYLSIDTVLAAGNHVIVMRQATIESDAVIIAATRSERDAEGVAVPVSVITSNDIAKSGQVRLSNLLNEQTGLQLTANFGTGLQIQGFDADYTLIMIDGEPVIGRSAGTLDLRRIAVGNVKRIETVKGPSSALWGSDALAGVVNIITETPSKRFSADVNARTASFGSHDVSVNLGQRTENQGTTAFFNMNRTDGYDLDGATAGQTGPAFRNFSGQIRQQISFGEATTLSVQARGFSEELDDSGALGILGEAESAASNRQFTDEWSINPVLKTTLRPGLNLALRHYSTRYSNSFTNLEVEQSADEMSTFKQRFDKAEAQLDYAPDGRHWLTLGSGGFQEAVEATRYIDKPAFTSLYVFVQHEWRVRSGLDFVYGARLDRHSEYLPQLSPKFSVRYQPSARFTFRFSGGRGFKAPDFRQLLLGFTNAVAGYSIYGSGAINEALSELEAIGQLSDLAINPSQLGDLKAESSWAFNGGAEYQAIRNINIKINLFYNLVNDMIDVTPAAFKTNGSTVYTYINLNRVFTRGMEAEVRWQAAEPVRITAGYQFLDARDRDVIDRIRDGRVYRTVGNLGQVERVTMREYGGLMNRSRHMANIAVLIQPEGSRFSGSVRAQHRGRYGMGDFNGNAILDTDNEYAPAYTLVNLMAQYTFRKNATLQAGVDNLFNQTNPQYQPFLAGRIFYTSLQLSL
jgi:outer membrane receptor for ferrienterochelin and colicins